MLIYLRLTVAGKRIEVSPGQVCEPARWKADAGRVSGTKEAVKAVNKYLDRLQAKVDEAHYQLEADGLEITPESLNRKFIGKEEPGKNLIEIFKDHNCKMAALVGQEFAPGTLGRYTTSLKHTVDFLHLKYQVKDMDIRKIDHAFVYEYEFYLRSVRKCANNTAVKYIKNFGKIIRLCLANGWLTVNPFANYKAKVKKVDRVYLTEAELYQMAAKEFGSERLEQVSDIFLFSCYTGLSYVDVQKLKRCHISTGNDGEQWIFLKPAKNGYNFSHRPGSRWPGNLY